MPPRGRPPVGMRVVLRLPVTVLAEIDAQADAAGMTRSAYLRAIIEREVITSD